MRNEGTGMERREMASATDHDFTQRASIRIHCSLSTTVLSHFPSVGESRLPEMPLQAVSGAGKMNLWFAYSYAVDRYFARRR